MEAQEEARDIFKWAEEEGLTGTNYVWIVTQSVIGAALNKQYICAGEDDFIYI